MAELKGKTVAPFVRVLRRITRWSSQFTRWLQDAILWECDGGAGCHGASGPALAGNFLACGHFFERVGGANGDEPSSSVPIAMSAAGHPRRSPHRPL